MRKSSRRLNRRSPSRRCSWSPRHSRVSNASATSSARVASAPRASSSSSTSTNSGWRRMRVADDPARSEQVAGALGGARMVAEGDRERGRPGGPLGQAPELEQPEVGIGGLRQPAEDHREELAHHPRAAGQTGGELADRGTRALDVGEPERGQPFLRRLGRQRTGAREGLEQRREEEPFVDAAHRALVLAVLGLERVRARCVPGRRGSRAPVRAAPAPVRRTGSGGSAVRRRAAGGARRCGGTGRRDRVGRRRRRST